MNLRVCYCLLFDLFGVCAFSYFLISLLISSVVGSSCVVFVLKLPPRILLTGCWATYRAFWRKWSYLFLKCYWHVTIPVEA